MLMTSTGKIDITRMSSLVDQIAWLRHHGHEVILVSSGAVACGRKELRVEHELEKVEQRQLYSAVGQVKLMNLYSQLFGEYNMSVGQVLTMKRDFEQEEQYNNLRACMELMLENSVIPIVNENDTVSVTGLMFTDNDELSGLVSQMMSAEKLILLSNVDGIYTGNPQDAASQLITRVSPDDDLNRFISESKSSAGRGGMQSKYHTAREVAKRGITVIIANGKRENILLDLIQSPDTTPHTAFAV